MSKAPRVKNAKIVTLPPCLGLAEICGSEVFKEAWARHTAEDLVQSYRDNAALRAELERVKSARNEAIAAELDAVRLWIWHGDNTTRETARDEISRELSDRASLIRGGKA